MAETVLISDTKAPGVRRVTLNRPDFLNAFDHEMAGRLGKALETIQRDLSTRVVILTGAGRGFCAGGDVRAMKESPDPAAYILELSRRLHVALKAIVHMPQPVIAAVNGPVAGGGLGLALAADLRVAGDSARFSTGHAKLGISPDGGPTHFLPRLVGDTWAAAMMMAGFAMSAREAFTRGLVIDVVPDESLDQVAEDLAAKIVRHPRVAIAQTKALLRQTWARGLEAQLEEERTGLGVTGSLPTFREGLSAFLEKRDPAFSSPEKQG